MSDRSVTCSFAIPDRDRSDRWTSVAPGVSATIGTGLRASNHRPSGDLSTARVAGSLLCLSCAGPRCAGPWSDAGVRMAADRAGASEVRRLKHLFFLFPRTCQKNP